MRKRFRAPAFCVAALLLTARLAPADEIGAGPAPIHEAEDRALKSRADASSDLESFSGGGAAGVDPLGLVIGGVFLLALCVAAAPVIGLVEGIQGHPPYPKDLWEGEAATVWVTFYRISGGLGFPLYLSGHLVGHGVGIFKGTPTPADAPVAKPESR